MDSLNHATGYGRQDRIIFTMNKKRIRQGTYIIMMDGRSDFCASVSKLINSEYIRADKELCESELIIWYAAT